MWFLSYAIIFAKSFYSQLADRAKYKLKTINLLYFKNMASVMVIDDHCVCSICKQLVNEAIQSCELKGNIYQFGTPKMCQPLLGSKRMN